MTTLLTANIFLWQMAVGGRQRHCSRRRRRRQRWRWRQRQRGRGRGMGGGGVKNRILKKRHLHRLTDADLLNWNPTVPRSPTF